MSTLSYTYLSYLALSYRALLLYVRLQRAIFGTPFVNNEEEAQEGQSKYPSKSTRFETCSTTSAVENASPDGQRIAKAKASPRLTHCGANWGRAFVAVGFLLGTCTKAVVLGMDRNSYGVWDRDGGHSVDQYPYTRGQSCDLSWGAVNAARNSFNWSALDSLLQTADDQNQMFAVKVSPIDASAPGRSMPTWMFSAGVPSIICPTYRYGYYLDTEFKIYFEEMVRAFGKHVREDLPPRLQRRIAFVRVDTGCTGDEKPYENKDVPSVSEQYQIATQQWQEFRLWAFEVYRQAFQTLSGPIIPLLFQAVEPPQYQVEWNWVSSNIMGGVGIKHGGQLRGHHYAESESNVVIWKPLAVDSEFKLFSRNEMDQTWRYSYFQLNVRLGMFWAAVEQLNVGMSIWDWSGTCLESAATNDFEFAATFFNTWAAELVPATARGGFCFFHEGLDSADTTKFPTATYGSAGINNLARYTAICNAYASQGAQMDHLEAAAMGNVAARDPPPDGQKGYNDAGWKIRPGNYDRFITQINSDKTSKAVWRCRGQLNTSSHPYDRFGRRFDSASGMNMMYFDVHDGLTPTPGQSIQLSVVYLDKGTGQFGLLYDAVGNSQKSAFTVTKVDSNTWKPYTVTVTDWVFGNNGPNGADLVLTSVDSNDDIFSHIALVKLVSIALTTIGSGTVLARNDATVYSPVSGTYPTGTRLEMICTPASGWKFSGWNGGLSGGDPRAIFYPTEINTEITATFVYTGALESTDDFESGMWAGGIGWSGSWIVVPTATPGSTVQLNAAGSITRTLSVPIPKATLSFSWDMDRITSGTEYGCVDVYDGTWYTVWSQTEKGSDSGSTADLVTAHIDLSAYGPISQIRFRLVAGDSTDRFWIGFVTLTSQPATVQPIGSPSFKPTATVRQFINLMVVVARPNIYLSVLRYLTQFCAAICDTKLHPYNRSKCSPDNQPLCVSSSAANANSDHQSSNKIPNDG